MPFSLLSQRGGGDQCGSGLDGRTDGEGGAAAVVGAWVTKTSPETPFPFYASARRTRLWLGRRAQAGQRQISVESHAARDSLSLCISLWTSSQTSNLHDANKRTADKLLPGFEFQIRTSFKLLPFLVKSAMHADTAICGLEYPDMYRELDRHREGNL